MSAGISARYFWLRIAAMTMIASGTTIERIVFGSRSRE